MWLGVNKSSLQLCGIQWITSSEDANLRHFNSEMVNNRFFFFEAVFQNFLVYVQEDYSEMLSSQSEQRLREL